METRAKVYRNIERRQEWLGLEPFDAIALGALLWLLMLIYRHAFGWNALIVACAWVALRLVKRGRPPGFLLALIRFCFVRRPLFSAAERDREAALHPFRKVTL